MREYTAETWFKAPERGVRCSRLRAPYQNIFVGSDPLDGMTEAEAKSFDAIVNVSCSPCAYFNPAFVGQSMHWIPINEMGYWGFMPFFWFKKVMDHHHKLGHKVYVHCHAGAYRSPTFTVYWLTSLGHSLEEAIEIEWNDPEVTHKFKTENNGRHMKWKLEYPYKCGNINPHTIKMLRRMQEQPEYSFGGIVHHPGGDLEQSREIWGSRHWAAKWRHWFRWWYRPMYKLERRIDWAMYYVKGQRVRDMDGNPIKFPSTGWHISYREDMLGKLCWKTVEKWKAFVYRLSKPSLRIYDKVEHLTISLS